MLPAVTRQIQCLVHFAQAVQRGSIEVDAWALEHLREAVLCVLPASTNQMQAPQSAHNVWQANILRLLGQRPLTFAQVVLQTLIHRLIIASAQRAPQTQGPRNPVLPSQTAYATLGSLVPTGVLARLVQPAATRTQTVRKLV